MTIDSTAVVAAVAAIAAADTLIISAGAGMGVDSGLPDFRGSEGFWNAYPPYRALGLSFIDLANPRWFVDNPALAWGFYGHRLALYRKTIPHAGFGILKGIGARMAGGVFVVTSNVDGQFQRAGFDAAAICEVHGAIEHFQCTQHEACGLWPASLDELDLDDGFRAAPPFPRCVTCGALARPNILMFGDGGWVSSRTEAQAQRFSAFERGERTDFAVATTSEVPRRSILADARGVVVVECGAGTAIPTIRLLGEQLARRGGTLVRINVREPEGPAGTIAIASGALAALTAIAAAMPSP